MNVISCHIKHDSKFCRLQMPLEPYPLDHRTSPNQVPSIIPKPPNLQRLNMNRLSDPDAQHHKTKEIAIILPYLMLPPVTPFLNQNASLKPVDTSLPRPQQVKHKQKQRKQPQRQPQLSPPHSTTPRKTNQIAVNRTILSSICNCTCLGKLDIGVQFGM